MASIRVPQGQRGQGARAKRRLGPERLDRNMVVRCSDELYEAAQDAAGRSSLSLSDYVRSLILRDLDGAGGA